MFDCLPSSLYAMKVDIMEEIVVQDSTTFALDKTWTITSSRVPALIEPIQSQGATERASGKSFKNEYSEHDLIYMTIGTRLSKRDRVTNIRDATGRIIYTELEVTGEPATEYEVIGEKLVITMFGSVTQYEYLLGRVAVQDVK